MLVQCPSCHTTYRVSNDLITKPNPTFRCSRCKHIFVLRLKSEVRPVSKTTTPPSITPHQDENENRELSFSFPPPEKREAREEKREETPASPMVEEQTSPPPDKEQAPPPTNDSFIIPEEGRPPRTGTTTETELQFEKDWQRSFPPLEEREPALALDPHEDRPVSTIPYLSLFGALLLVYSLLTLTHQAQPKTMETFIKAIPWLGSSVFKNNHLREGIVLQSLRSSFQTIPRDRAVFVVSGTAVNHNPVSVREVRIEGHIYNTEGKEIGRQAIWVGNPISPKIMKNLTAQDISILQKLSPQKRFEISPEGSKGFVIVFLKPNGEIKDFSCRVLSAQRGA